MAEGNGKVYATVPLAIGELGFATGDELHLHITPGALQALIDRGEASYEPPADADTTPAYALTPLSYHPHTSGYDFATGDRVDGILPAPVLAACIARGDATRDKKAAEAAAAAEAQTRVDAVRARASAEDP